MSYVKYLRNVLGEGFKEFITKFSSEDENINAYVEKFKLLKTRNKIKGVEADIDHWIKKDFDSFKTFIDSFVESELKSRKETKKEAYKNIVAENGEYVIIKINNADEMYSVGKGTVWCVASGEKETAYGYYRRYTRSSNFYVAIKKNLGEMEMLKVAHGANNEGQAMIYPYWDKIAIQVKFGDGFGDVIVYWNAGDFNHDEGSEELSKVNLPKYEFKYEFKIPDDWKLNDDGTYDVEGDVSITDVMLDGGKFPVKFGRVLKTFHCSYCTSLTSLEGSPESVVGSFDCEGCTSLTSLEGAPESVGGIFNCSGCTSLTSLEGSPKSVGGDFFCVNCTSLTSLEGAPKSLKSSFFCSGCTSLTSLEGSPKSVGGDFICDYCTSWTSLEGAPESVGLNFFCYGCTSLTSLEGAPESVGGIFNCADCISLTSLEGAPKSLKSSFFCSGCTSLTSLEGSPKSVGGDFSCEGSVSLTSLNGAPKKVGGWFSCKDCPKLKLSELDKISLLYRDKVKHTMKESTFYYWNKTYNKLNG